MPHTSSLGSATSNVGTARGMDTSAGFGTDRLFLADSRLALAVLDAALGALALGDAALGVAGPSGREVPGFGTLLAFAMLGGLAAPGLRRTVRGMRVAEQRLRAAEQRVRRERIRRYVAARDRVRASAA